MVQSFQKIKLSESLLKQSNESEDQEENELIKQIKELAIADGSFLEGSKIFDLVHGHENYLG